MFLLWEIFGQSIRELQYLFLQVHRYTEVHL